MDAIVETACDRVRDPPSSMHLHHHPLRREMQRSSRAPLLHAIQVSRAQVFAPFPASDPPVYSRQNG